MATMRRPDPPYLKRRRVEAIKAYDRQGGLAGVDAEPIGDDYLAAAELLAIKRGFGELMPVRSEDLRGLIAHIRRAEAERDELRESAEAVCARRPLASASKV